MILSQKDIEALARKGVPITGKDGKRVNPNGKPESEIFYLRLIAGLLEHLLAKPDPQFPKFPDMQPSNVIVKPADVIVDRMEIPPHPEPIRKWKFVLKKDFQGHTEEIIATAME